MTINNAVERELAQWFEAEASAVPDDLLSRSVARIETTSQRPGFLVRDTYPSRGAAIGRPLLLPAVLVLVALTIAAMGFVVGGGGQVATTPLPATTTDGRFAPATDLAFRAQFDPADDVSPFKWRAGAYAEYTLSGWNWGDTSRERIAAGEPLRFSEEGDAVSLTGRRRIEVTLTPLAFDGPTILGPSLIQGVDRPVDAIAVGNAGWFASIESAVGGEPYTVSALIQVEPEEAGGLTEARLRGSGTAYSAEMLRTYASLPEGAMGPVSTRLLAAIRAAVPPAGDPGNPYDLARAMERYLGNEAHFAYDADVRDEAAAGCGDVSTVECFATIKRGYCEYYASTMAVLMRAAGVPARVAYGFRPGERTSDGLEDVGGWLAHWWVEVYFPGVGWFVFDPTGGGIGRPQPLPQGPQAR